MFAIVLVWKLCFYWSGVMSSQITFIYLKTKTPSFKRMLNTIWRDFRVLLQPVEIHGQLQGKLKREIIPRCSCKCVNVYKSFCFLRSIFLAYVLGDQTRPTSYNNPCIKTFGSFIPAVTFVIWKHLTSFSAMFVSLRINGALSTSFRLLLI